jgi:hypothetical protein
MKQLIVILLVLSGVSAYAGSVGLPAEQIALPKVEEGGSYLVCVWDAYGERWAQSHVSYDKSGAYSFQIPEWEKWYWVGLWDSAGQRYIFGKWVGHFKAGS